MSAIIDEDGENGHYEPIRVLISLHDQVDGMDVMGPLEVFSQALHNKKDEGSKAFQTLFCGPTELVETSGGAQFRCHMTHDEALTRLSEVDVLVIPGGGSQDVLKSKKQPLKLIKAFAEMQQKNPSRERTLMSVCTGSLFLAETGILSGLTATTHPDYMTKMEIICSNAAQRELADRCDVVDARYVVNNLRFELGDNEDENPYIMSKREYKRRKSSAAANGGTIQEQANGANGVGGARRPSSARKGSMSLKMSNNRRESVLKRANLRLGGLRVLTASGVTSGIDGALYLVGALVADDAAEEVARIMCHKWNKGVVVDGTDV